MTKTPDQEGADLVMEEMSKWLGMDEDETRRACAHVLAAMKFENTVTALRSAALRAYQEVMFRQAAKFATMEASLAAQGWDRFVDRVTAALKKVA